MQSLRKGKEWKRVASSPKPNYVANYNNMDLSAVASGSNKLTTTKDSSRDQDNTTLRKYKSVLERSNGNITTTTAHANNINIEANRTKNLNFVAHETGNTKKTNLTRNGAKGAL